MRRAAALALLACCLVGCGCADPDAQQPPPLASSQPGSPGEPLAPPPRSPSREASSAALPSPQKTLERYARLYINWDYRTLAAEQRRLAALAAGAARASELLAAVQSTRDVALVQGRVWNRGSVISLAPELRRPGVWVVVTREQTGGSGEYAALPAGFHVTLARLARAGRGWVVSGWEPQD